FDGVDYRISLRQREPALLFGRELQTTRARLDRQMRALAVRVGTAAAHRAKLPLAGPLTLHIADLAAQTADDTRLFVAYPVGSNSARAGGYTMVQHPAASVLSVTYDADRND